MKLILAVIQPFKLDDVTRSLSVLPGFSGMTVVPVRGVGREQQLRGSRGFTELEYFADKVQIEIAVDDGVVDAMVGVITSSAGIGRAGDGIVMVIPIETLIHLPVADGSA